MRTLLAALALCLCGQASSATTYPPVGLEGTFPPLFPDTLSLVHTEFQHFPDTLPSASSGWVVDSATRLGTKRTSLDIQLSRVDGKLQRVRMIWPQMAPPDNFIDYVHVRDSLGRVIRMVMIDGSNTISATWEWDRTCPTQTTSNFSRYAWTADSTGHCTTANQKSRADSTSPWVVTNKATVASQTWIDDRLVADYDFSGADTVEKSSYAYLPDGRLIQAVHWRKGNSQWWISSHKSVVYDAQGFVSSTATSYEYGVEVSNTVILPAHASLAVKSVPARLQAILAHRTSVGLEFRNASASPLDVTLRSATGKHLGNVHVPAGSSVTASAPAGNGVVLWQAGGTSGILAPLH